MHKLYIYILLQRKRRLFEPFRRQKANPTPVLLKKEDKLLGLLISCAENIKFFKSSWSFIVDGPESRYTSFLYFTAELFFVCLICNKNKMKAKILYSFLLVL